MLRQRGGAAGAGIYTVAARLLRITEFKVLTSTLRISNT
jgi:hypothetical protein